jgi:hypothetical protein
VHEKLADSFLVMVQSYVNLWYGGHVPEDRAEFVQRILNSYLPASMRHVGGFSEEEWLKERESVAELLHQAVKTLLSARGRVN